MIAGPSNKSSRSITRLRDDDVPTPRKIYSSRSLSNYHSKASIMALAHIITKSSLKHSTMMESVDDSQSGEMVINVIEPDYSDSQYKLPFEEVSKLAVFFEESIREILISSTEEMGEVLVREFLSNFLNGTEENEDQVNKLCKLLLAMPQLWEEAEYFKAAKTTKYHPDMMSKVASKSSVAVLENTFKDLMTKNFTQKEVSEVRRELRKLYYQKACQVSRTTPHPILIDAFDNPEAENGIIYARGRGGEGKGTLSDADMLALSLCVKYGLRVTRLYLGNNEITDFGMWHLSHLLRIFKLSELVKIDVSNNSLTDRGITIFSDTIKDHPVLKTIILSGNKISEFGGLWLVSALRQNEQLAKLDLTNTDMEMTSIIALLVVLCHHPTLRTLKLGRPLVFSQDEPLIHLSHLFKTNQTILKVCVPKFSITDFGVATIVPGLLCNETLVHLDLSCIVWDGAKLLANYISASRSLKVLNLNANRLEDVGAVYIAQALAQPWTTLQQLIVTNNKIGKQGLCALASGVHRNQRLKYLYVWGNKMEGKACLALASLLTSDRLKCDCVDFIPYRTVDGIVSLALARH